MAEGLKGLFTGTLLLDSLDPPNAPDQADQAGQAGQAGPAKGKAIIGNLSMADGKSYILRLGADGLFEKLKGYNGKSVSVTGICVNLCTLSHGVFCGRKLVTL